jgi:heme/copper-type cytochrome/quinol oxidase subunit 2
VSHTSVRFSAGLALAFAFGAAVPALAADTVELTLKGHGFTPASVKAPANARFRIEITNQDSTPAEFESSDLRAEKIVVPGAKISVMAGPLKPGTYTFVDDYHPDSAKGVVVVSEQQAGQ